MTDMKTYDMSSSFTSVHSSIYEMNDESFENFLLFETDRRFLLCASHDLTPSSQYRVLEIPKTLGNAETPNIKLDDNSYNTEHLKTFLSLLESADCPQKNLTSNSGTDGFSIFNFESSTSAPLSADNEPVESSLNSSTSSIVPIPRLRERACACAGLVKLLDGWYIHLITKRIQVGTIAGIKVYSCEESKIVRVVFLDHVDPVRAERYTSMFESFKMGGSTPDFFFAYGLDLTRSLQNTITTRASSFDERYCWNFRAAQTLLTLCPKLTTWWVQPMLQGVFEQRNSIRLHNSMVVTLTLIARRSRWYAGTRFNRRGIGRHAHVANHVESELIVTACTNDDAIWSMTNQQYASVCLYRGSIPLFWGHPSTQTPQPRPPILLTSRDNGFTTTTEHMRSLERDYGTPIVLLSLIRQSERKPKETILGAQLSNAVQSLRFNTLWADANAFPYITFDFLAHQHDNGDVSEALSSLVEQHIRKIGFFSHCSLRDMSDTQQPDTLQRGVFRVNCIDCLDRTNYAQYVIVLEGLFEQLQAIGVAEEHRVEDMAQIIVQLKDVFMIHGDRIANQYAGSGAMHKNQFETSGDQDTDDEKADDDIDSNTKAAPSTSDRLRSFAGKIKKGAMTVLASDNAITAVRRYYSNAVTDASKQQAINIFTGAFCPEQLNVDIWEYAINTPFDEETVMDTKSWSHPWIQAENSSTHNNATDEIDLAFSLDT